MLCGNPLPWVESGKHLGQFFMNKIDGMKYDIKVKRAKFIDKSYDLLQEYHFAQPRIKLKMNKIFNSHFTGSTIWDLFSHEASMLENSWNRNIRIMFQLPLETLHYFICPISGRRHLWFILLKRFLSFAKKCEVSPKKTARHLFKVVQKDVQSITGSNIRNFLLLLEKENFSHVVPNDTLSLEYHKVENENTWKIGMLEELIEIRQGILSVDLNQEEIEMMIADICIT